MNPDFENFLWSLSIAIILLTGILLGLLVDKILLTISFGSIGLLIARGIKEEIER